MMNGARINIKIFYSLATGLLLALSWPARGFPFLAFVAFIPLFFLEDDLMKQQKEKRSIVFFMYAWVAFFVFNLLTTWWILFATIPGMIVAVILNAIFMAIPWWLMHLGRRILPGRQGLLSIVFLWLSFEFLHARWEVSWSWLDLGNVFAAFPAWVQWYDITGTAGGSLWVLIINILLFSAVKNFLETRIINKKNLVSASLALVLFVVPAIISFVKWHSYEEQENPVKVVIVQPAEDPYDPVYSHSELRERVEHIISLANEQITPNTRFVVAPEGANPRSIWLHEAEEHYTVRRLREHVSEHPGLVWVMGSFLYELFEPGDKLPPEAQRLQNDNRYYVAYNSIIFVEEGQPLQYYHKSKLVPGIERMPYFRLLKPIGRLVDRFGGISGSLGTHDKRLVYETETGHQVGAAVCYESIYGDFMAGYVRGAAGLLFIATNDGWWRDTPGYRQHNQYARLRAIELRRSIARSASTGISSFINQKGEITQFTNWWEADAIAAELNVNNRITFFAARGNFLGRLSVFLTIFFCLYLLSQRMIRKS